MLVRKKLAFQLTPLLDLLLIVIFAQYMEVQQTSRKAEQEIARRAGEQTAQALEAQHRAEERLAAFLNDRGSLQTQLQAQLADVTEEMQRVLNQRRDLADLVARLFQIPKEVLDKALTSPDRSPEEQQQLRAMVNELADEHRNDVIKHLITHQAMRKRVDVWTLFIETDGNAYLKVGDETKLFLVRDQPNPIDARRLANLSPREQSLAMKRAEAEAADAFAQRLFNAYKTLPQPKSIVVLVVSWNGDLARYYREPARMGLDAAMRLFHTNNDRTQFIPAILGAELEG
jgi:hypothetical protein